uniref:RNA-directed RNA polymerase L n=1 Tax=Maize yellow striate virus TaxID=1168550 RepID=A0A2D1GTQ3_9RHAB|nr:polymerase protein [Maize yellow striate virus]
MDFLDDEVKKRMRGLGDFHLRSAIVPIDINGLKEGKGRARELKSFKKIIRNYPDVYKGDPASVLATILKSSSSGELRSILMFRETVELINAEYKGLGFLTANQDPMEKLLMLLMKVRGIQSRYASSKISYQRLLMCANAMNSQREYGVFNLDEDVVDGAPSLTVNGITVGIWGELITVSSPDMPISLFSLDVLRMIVDKLTERDNVIVSSFIGEKIFPQIYPRVETISKIFDLFDSWLYLKGNSGYKMMKTFEALITGVILQTETSPYHNSSDFLENTILGLDHGEQEVARRLVDILTDANPTPHHLTQIMGLFRLWGHPEVDAKKGVEKVRLIGTKRKYISEHASLIAGRKFKEIFFSEYFRKNRVYPACEVNPDCWLHEFITSSLGINFKDPRYHISDWDSVEPKETFSIPTTFNLSMIVSDTAISPTREEIYECQEQGVPPMDPFIRRGVLKWMRDGLIDCDSLLRGINDHPKGLDKNNRIIGLYPKEREMNPVARMFALMSLKMRSYVVITENMLSENILPYIPGITMTYSMLDLAKEMIRSTRAQSKQGDFSRTFCINMDFEKWNLNMRKESTYYTFLEVGRLFGLPQLYNRTYDIFRNSLIYLADGSYTPSLDDKLESLEKDLDLCYTNHIGGFEGLRQKGWTIFTVVLIAHVCDQLGIQHRLMGQGDNQVLMVTIHSKNARLCGIDSQASKNEISDKLKILIRRLQETFDCVGLPLKPLETWISDIYFSYGKMPIYKGVPLCSSLKRISRIFYFSNEDLMTIDNALGAVTANSQAAVMADTHPAIPYFIAKWQHLQCLSVFSRYHPLVGEPMMSQESIIKFRMRLDKGEMWESETDQTFPRETLLMVYASVPKTLGGLNIVTYFDMILRGYSDPPMKDYQFLTLLTEGATGNLRRGLINWGKILLSPSVDYLHILQDPTSLNILCPPNSNTLIKRMIHNTIEEMESESEFAGWFKELISISAEKKMDGIVEKLTSGEEINARLCHDIMGATLFGYSDAIASKVDKTVTLSRMTVAQQDVVSSLVNGEKRIWNYLLWRTNYKGGQPRISECPSKQIRHLRDKGWKKKIIGISTPYPFHYMGGLGDTDRPDSYVEVVVNDLVLSHPDRLLLTSGASLPYLGSVTKEKLHNTAARAAYGTEPLITRPLRLLRTIGWFIDEKSNLAKSIENLLKAVTDLDPDEVIVIPEHVKGSMMHRYVDMALKHGSLWMPSFGPPSHLSISTNYFAEYAKGSKNVTMHFQALLGLVQYSVINRCMSEEPRKILRYYRTCKDCITPVDEPSEDIRESLSEQEIPSRPDNPYLYVKKEKIALIHKRDLDNYESISVVNKSHLIQYPYIGRKFLTEVLAVRAASSILYQSSNDESGVFDISGVSRTIFLKLDIRVFLLTITKMLWIGASASARVASGEIYPSWEFMKGSLIRRVWEAPASAFSILSGLYLWEENINEMVLYPWAVMPLTYPATPNSVCIAAKNSLIGFMSRLDSIVLSSSWLVSPLIKVDPGVLLKSNLLFYKGKIKSECNSCVLVGMSCRVKSSSDWSEISRIKCQAGHSVFTLKGWRMIRKVVLDIETLADHVPTATRRVKERLPRGFPLSLKSGITYELTSNMNFPGSSNVSYQMPGEEFLLRPKYDYSDNYEYSLPTRALYRVYEGISEVTDFLNYGSVLVMGDGFGYSSLVCKMVNPNAKVLSWTLIDTSSGIQHCLRLSRPPTHYMSNLEIDNSPTIELPSDVSDARFPDSMKYIVREKKIDIVISEVELLYSGVSQSSEELIELYWGTESKCILHKYQFKSFSEIKNLIEVVRGYYNSWKIFISGSVNFKNGSFWILMWDKRLEKLANTKLTYNSVISLYDTLRFNHERMLMVSPGEYCHDINKYLDNTFLKHYREQLLDIWFQDASIIHWRSRDFTQMYYALRTGKRPASVLDTQGNTVYYLHSDMAEKIFERLLTLALSLLKPENRNIGLLDLPWRLKWEKSQETVSVRSTYRWAPALIQDGNTSIPDRVKSNIARYLPGVAAVRRSLGSLYEVVPDRVRFQNPGRTSKVLKFEITRGASFTTPY